MSCQLQLYSVMARSAVNYYLGCEHRSIFLVLRPAVAAVSVALVAPPVPTTPSFSPTGGGWGRDGRMGPWAPQPVASAESSGRNTSLRLRRRPACASKVVALDARICIPVTTVRDPSGKVQRHPLTTVDESDGRCGLALGCRAAYWVPTEQRPPRLCARH